VPGVGTSGPTGRDGAAPKRASGHTNQRGPGSGTIVGSTKSSKSGVIVIRGGAGTRTYGPFTRKAGSYAVNGQQPTPGRLGIAVEPMAVSSTEKTVLELTGNKGQAVSSIPWRTFYVWVPRAPSSYVVTFTPQG
jgi:hypothetical protein